MKIRWLIISLLLSGVGCGDESPTEPQRFPAFRDRSHIAKPAPAAPGNDRDQAEPLPNQFGDAASEGSRGGVSFSGASIPDAPSTTTADPSESDEPSVGDTAAADDEISPADDDAFPTAGSNQAEIVEDEISPADDDAFPTAGANQAEIVEDDTPPPNSSTSENQSGDEDELGAVTEDATQDEQLMREDNEQPAIDAELDPQAADQPMTQRIQRGLGRFCVDAFCHASTNNQTNLEDITRLIGQQARGSAALYVAPGEKEQSYLYNVMLPFNQRNIPTLGTRMPPARAGIAPEDVEQFREELGAWIDSLPAQ